MLKITGRYFDSFWAWDSVNETYLRIYNVGWQVVIFKLLLQIFNFERDFFTLNGGFFRLGLGFEGTIIILIGN